MSRCICCNNELNNSDMRKVKSDGSPEDFCSVCLGEVEDIDLPEDREYLFEFDREGVKEIFIEE